MGEYRHKIMAKVAEGIAELTANSTEITTLGRIEKISVHPRPQKPMPSLQRSIGNRQIGQRVAKERRHQGRKNIPAHHDSDHASYNEMEAIEWCERGKNPRPNPA